MSRDNEPFDAATIEPRAEAPNSQAKLLSKWLLTRLYELCGKPPIRIELWDGTDVCSSEPPIATVRIRDRATLHRLLLNPDLYFGEAYMAGSVEVEGELVAFLQGVSGDLRDTAAPGRIARAVLAACSGRRANSLSGARRNIHHHYDIGNDFYTLWLDREAMQYTCAYFPDPAASLEHAQVAKLDHVCRKLRLKPGETVVEAGCGWGGLARHMARRYGVTVKAYNISRQQVLFAREQAAAEGLSGRVQYIEDDYRNISGQFDVFVSVGMLEHVGPENYRELGRVIDRAIAPDGRGLIHTIGRNRAAAMNAWIERRIFPGARPPSLRQMMEIFEPHFFSVLDVENLRLHYALTLQHWLRRFEDNLDRIRTDFDEAFIRAWRLYLAGSIAAFTTGDLQLFQVLFNRGRSNDVPWTRRHLYSES